MDRNNVLLHLRRHSGTHAVRHYRGNKSWKLEGIQITQEMLVASAILMLLPILMIFLSLALKAIANRWINMILGIVYACINLVIMVTTGGAWFYYYILAVVEVVFSALIVWYAWRWK